MDELIVWVARHLVDDPDAVRVDVETTPDTTTYRLSVAPGDLGKVIGRQGRLARALRSVVRAGGGEGGRRVTLEIVE